MEESFGICTKADMIFGLPLNKPTFTLVYPLAPHQQDTRPPILFSISSFHLYIIFSLLLLSYHHHSVYHQVVALL